MVNANMVLVKMPLDGGYYKWIKNLNIFNQNNNCLQSQVPIYQI